VHYDKDFQESDLILAPAGRKERDREVQSLTSDGLCRAANLIADLSISTGLKHGDFLEPVGMEFLVNEKLSLTSSSSQRRSRRG